MQRKKCGWRSGLLMLSIITGIAYSCTKADVQFGGATIGEGFGIIAMSDTFTPVLSTVLIDSFASSGTGYATVGAYKDPVFGAVRSSSYMQFAPPTYSPTNTDSFDYAIYDSLSLYLKYADSFYGDSTKNLTLNVYRLSQNLLFGENLSYLYNTDSFSVYPTPLGSTTFTLRTGRDFFDSLSIRLDDALGKELFNKMISGNEDIQSSSQFINNYFRGIKIAPVGDDGFGVRFLDSAVLRLHYRMPGDDRYDHIAAFTLSDKTLQFNSTSVDRSGTVLQNLNSTHKTIPSEQTGNMAYMQAISGSLAKISFPSINNLPSVPGYLRLSRAILTIQPVLGTWEGYFGLPPQLYLSATDFNNAVGTYLTSSTSTIANGSLYYDYQNGANTGYSYDITSYISTLIGSPYDPNNGLGLLVTPPSTESKTTFNRLILGDRNHDYLQGQIKLQLYYIAVQ